MAFIRTSSTIGIATRLKEKAVWTAGSVAPRTASCHIYVCWPARALARLAKNYAHTDPAPCELLSRQKVVSACLACTASSPTKTVSASAGTVETKSQRSVFRIRTTAVSVRDWLSQNFDGNKKSPQWQDLWNAALVADYRIDAAAARGEAAREGLLRGTLAWDSGLPLQPQTKATLRL